MNQIHTFQYYIMNTSLWTTTLEVHSFAFLTEKEHEWKWNALGACLLSSRGNTCGSSADPRSAQPYLRREEMDR